MDAIDPSVLVSACASRQFDFLEMQEQELHNIVIPLDLEVGEPGTAIQTFENSGLRTVDYLVPLGCPEQHVAWQDNQA